MTTKYHIGHCVLLAILLGSSAFAVDAPKVNFEDHVKPVFREHCLSCHNQNEKKGGLALDSYAGAIEGGGSGEIVFDGDAAGSRLYQLMAHEDTPEMPPQQPKVAEAKLVVIRDWINGGLLETARIPDMRIGPRHHHLAGFNRLAQGFQHGARKLLGGYS